MQGDHRDHRDTDSTTDSATPSTASTVKLIPQQLEQALSEEDEPDLDFEAYPPPVVPLVPVLELEAEPEPRLYPLRAEDLGSRDPDDTWEAASLQQRRVYRSATLHAWEDTCAPRGSPTTSWSQLTPAEYANFRAEAHRRYEVYCEERGCDP